LHKSSDEIPQQRENNVRDMIFKKYTIIYEIKPKEDIIEILDIFNRNKP
jgi:hypothetical protein